MAPSARAVAQRLRVRVRHGDADAALLQGPHEGRQADTARTDDEHVIARTDLGAVHTVQPNGEWFHQCRVGRVVRLEAGSCGARGRRRTRRIRPLDPSRCSLTSRNAIPRPALQYWHSPHEITGSTATLVPTWQSSARDPDGDDFAAQLVSHHHAGRCERLGLDVGSAHAAGRDADHQLVGSGAGSGRSTTSKP